MNKVRRVVWLTGVVGLILCGQAQAGDPKLGGKTEQTRSIWSSVWNAGKQAASVVGLFGKSFFFDIELKGEGIRRPIVTADGKPQKDEEGKTVYELDKTAHAMFPLSEILNAAKGVGSYFYTTSTVQVAKDAGHAVLSVKDSIYENPWNPQDMVSYLLDMLWIIPPGI